MSDDAKYFGTPEEVEARLLEAVGENVKLKVMSDKIAAAGRNDSSSPLTAHTPSDRHALG